jgi:hypothetical protein
MTRYRVRDLRKPFGEIVACRQHRQFVPAPSHAQSLAQPKGARVAGLQPTSWLGIDSLSVGNRKYSNLKMERTRFLGEVSATSSRSSWSCLQAPLAGGIGSAIVPTGGTMASRCQVRDRDPVQANPSPNINKALRDQAFANTFAFY